MTAAIAGYATLLKRGDGGAGAATQASRTIGTSNSQIVIKAKAGISNLVGALGNTMSCQIVNGGVSQPLTVSVSGSGANASLTINAATNGSSVITSTVNDIIAACSLNASIDALFDFTTGAGNGTGVIAAAASLAFLASGANGGEAFTTISEVTNVSFSGLKLDFAEATSMDSVNAFKERIATLKDAGTLTFDINFIPNSANQQLITTDFKNRALRNFQLVYTDTSPTTWTFAAYISQFAPSIPVDGKVSANVVLQLTGSITIP